jgi:hypothetical protein
MEQSMCRTARGGNSRTFAAIRARGRRGRAPRDRVEIGNAERLSG